jgi:D-amino peptidase
MIMIGFHARSGTPGALLPHTYSRKNLSLKINGQLLGEIGMEAAIAGDFGIPTWLVTGDSAGMREAQDDIPGVKTVVVKEALDEFQALCYPAKHTHKLIYEAGRDVILSPPGVRPLRIEPPIQLEITMAASGYLDKLRNNYPEIFFADNLVKIDGNSVTEVWSRYSKMYRAVKRL